MKMGTPLKALSTLLSPRVITPVSPLSPKLLSVSAKFNNYANSTKTLAATERLTHVAKKLEFSQATSPNRFAKPVQIRVTDYTTVSDAHSDIVINSPNKRNIFEKGIEANRGHTVLGVGSFGKVIRGVYKGKTVAVKVVRNTSTIGEKNALRLSHDNIAKTMDIIQNQEGCYSLIIMEYFPNSKQLRTILEDHDFQMVPKVINFAVDVCNGIDFIHKKGILHLDIKPQNVLVVDNVCKICDFGNSVRINATGNFEHKGTAIYTAPELLQGKFPTEKCDIYSFGILLWQLKERCSPYCEIDNVETVIYKVVKCKWRPDNLSPMDDFSKLYQACWDAESENRPNTCNIIHKLKNMF